MPSEFGPTNIIPKQQLLETLKETYKQRLDAILYKQLTVENIETFADDALSNMVQLTEDILNESKKNPEFKFDSSLDKKTQEDGAYKILDLPDIQETLQSIINKKDEINSLKTYIHENTENVNKVITPPQENFKVRIEEGDGSFKEKKIFPRLLTLLYILQNDFEIDPKNIPIKEGIITSKMMRQISYSKIEIPDLERVVYICDEEGNASYIFDAKKLAEQKITLEELDLDDKEVKNSFIQKYPGIGVRLIQSKNWRANITELLGGEISEKQKEEDEGIQKEKKSEFLIMEKEVLSFKDFKNEVRKLYPGGSIKEWYWKEYKKHSGWPSNPHKTYVNEGWESYQELVDKKKDFLSFHDLKKEIQSLYQNQGDIQRWYHKERKNHLNWPSNPPKFYESGEWINWLDFVGLKKKEFLSFEDFQNEVKSLYKGQSNVLKWYNKEKKNHLNWPHDPHDFYEKHGWSGFSKLVEKNNPNERHFLPFKDFKNEVMNLYNGEVNIRKWYSKEQKNHSNWPFSVERIYKNDGYVGWQELVGKKKEE